jgi:lipoprotein-anchoring transpeptidase ErfK/SrfK
VRRRVSLGAGGNALVVAVLAASICAPSGEAHPQPGVGPTVPRTTFVAYASHSRVSVYGSETATRVRQTLTNPTDDGAVISFLVRSLHRGRARIYTDPYRVKIDLRRHRLTVWRFGSVTMRAPVGVGRAVNPTPQGTYYIVSRIRPVEPASVYGAFAFGLSGHSNVFARFGFGGDGRIGLHGTNDPAGVGHDVSHGCIRMTNRAILRLSRLLPLGTPVAITHG